MTHARFLRGLAALLLAGCQALALAQGADDTALDPGGTLAKLRETGTITLGYRQSSIPFSFVSARGEPIGYSIDLCKLLVDAISEAVHRPLAVKWLPVTADSRIQAVVSGQVDLECGSTTSNRERQRQVAFSPTFFVSGTKLLVRQGSPIGGFRDLAGRKVIVTSGTTNEKTMHELAARFKIPMTIVVGADHAASFAQLQAGAVDAFATDDVLLYGLVAQSQHRGDFQVVGDFLSYDPYGLMFRKSDPAFAQVVNDAFHALAREHEIERRYQRWFTRALPSGASLDLPMSPQLETLIELMATRSE